jgi:hypothetical protein
MTEALTIIGIIVGIIAAVFAYLQWNHPKAPNNPSLAPNHSGVILKRVLETKVIRVGFFHYPPLMDYDDTAHDGAFRARHLGR